MIEFNFEAPFDLDDRLQIRSWIYKVIDKERFKVGDINYIFCSDHYLVNINLKYLNHNTLTDIITFDYTLGKIISGDIYVSFERVLENAREYRVSMSNELHRVMIHGILHCCGYNDKTEEEKRLMREKEDYYLSLRDF